MLWNNKYIRFLLFLTANFLALIFGVILMNNGPQEAWYASLNQAPWTPEGWVFGMAWSIVMFCFSIYMTRLSFLFPAVDKKQVLLFSVQWVLNVGWNYVFFNQHFKGLGLLVITLLWLLVGYFTFKYLEIMKVYTIFILPYLIWMAMATSLNAYIVL